MTIDDPFHHLHDEDYARPYLAGLAGADDFRPIGGRPVQSLDGAWRLTLDLFDEGLRQKWFALDETPAAQWSVPRDYEIEAGELVAVPSCWNLLKPEWKYFEGAAWYTRRFDWAQGAPDERVMLNVGAANYLALVFLNGAFVGGHRGGSTPFSLDATQHLREGDNRIQIMVENRRASTRAPMQHFDWFNYGGLYREVSLMRLPAVHIVAATARLLPGGGQARFAMRLSAPIAAIARARVPALGIEAEIALAAGAGEATVDFTGEVWRPGRPALYDVVFECGGDRFVERVGFRTIETRGTDILLNGETLRLKGVCVHEDDLALGKVSTDADARRLFGHLKELGGNFLRLSHYPHHERVARIADEAGVLLWAEIPVYWAIAFEHADAFADARNQLRELIARDVNRASVILWGVGNENADTDARLSFMARLAQTARAADPSRLVAAACLVDRARFAIADRLAAHLDVIGLNEYFGWYEPDFADLDRLIANSAPDRPVIVSETGADAAPGRRGVGRALFSEDWQAEFYRQQIRRLAPTPWVAGIAAWLLYDFRSERRQTAAQKGFNRKGLIAEDKTTKKAAFATLAELYANAFR